MYVQACAIAAIVLSACMPARSAYAVNRPTFKPLDIPLTTRTAKRCFEVAAQIADQDQGKLWGIKLNAPVILVDWRSRNAVADHPDVNGLLTGRDGLFVGHLPESHSIAGTVTTWSGVRWVMLPWPLPKDDSELRHMLAHEMWHYVQRELGLPPQHVSNNHLEEQDARMWMIMEWNALAKAVVSTNDVRKNAIIDALSFRNCRRQQYGEFQNDERLGELNEGLAEYTGIKLASADDEQVRELACRNLQWARDWPSLVCSFAYVSGPLYGLLLDDLCASWRQDLSLSDDLGEITANAVRYQPFESPRVHAQTRRADYGWDALLVQESKRAARRRELDGIYNKRFIEGHVLRLQVINGSFQLDPRQVQAFRDYGHVHWTMRLADEWGVLSVVQGGVLVSPDWATVTVTAPRGIGRGRHYSGYGWNLDLANGWELVEQSVNGNYTVRRNSSTD